MVRAKVKLQYIENAAARRATYNKRIKGLVKKAQELGILCGIDACAIVYGPYDPSPVVWPSAECEVRRISLNYKSKPDMYLAQRKLDLEAFLKQSLRRSQEKLSRLERRNLELEMENVMSDLLGGRSVEQVPFGIIRDLMWVIKDKLTTVQNRVRNMEGPENARNLEGNERNAEAGLFGIGDVPIQAVPPTLPQFEAGPPSTPQFHAAPPSLPQFQAGPSNLPGLSHFQPNPYQYQHQP